MKALWALCVLAALPIQAADTLFLELSSRGQKLDVGLADFAPAAATVEASAQARALREVVRADLVFVGSFNLVEGGPVPLKGKIPLEAWDRLGTDVVATGFLEPSLLSGLRFVGRLYDTGTQKVLLEKTFPFTPETSRQTAHRWADDMIRYFTNQPGMATSRILFSNDASGAREIWIVDYDGFGPRQLTQTGGSALLPRLSPEGDRVVFTRFGHGGSLLEWVSIDGKIRRTLCRYEGLNSSASWFPDGTGLVATLSMGRDPNLYVVDREGQVQRALTQTSAVDTAPAVSPDGARVAFTSDRPGYPQLFLVDSTGANLRRLSTGTNFCDSPAWSPQGPWLAFAMSESKGHFDIYRMDAEGGNTQRLTYGEGDNENPSWSPDGRWLVFSSTRRGRPELFIMGADGSTPRLLGPLPGRSVTPQWVKGI